ncbi:MAG: hypothetical protein JSR97_10905 [Verrucomicrobia bacterium]|nr:hypothetical protein [Verrucomicrobiota bacterium]
MAIDKISYIEVFGTLLGGVIALRLALYFGPKYLDYRDKKVLAQKTEEEDRLQISQLTMGSFFADSKDQLWMWDVGSQSAGEAREAGPRAITIPGATKQDYEALIRGEFYQDNRGHKWKITQGELASPD